ncbi:MAG: hypothetical protein JW759_01665 [Candidatus Coatesbacteria bacterium]|nr:hypothetical protein [Candidatus Coatesbacteria bacterium]
MDRIKYMALCVLVCVLHLMFASFAALRKAQYSAVDRPLVLALVLCLPAWFLLTSAIGLFWPRQRPETWQNAALRDLVFYAFLPITTGGICALEIQDAVSVVRLFVIIAILKALAAIHWMTQASDSPGGRWPTIFLGTVLSLCVVLTVVAIGDNRRQLTASISLGYGRFITREDPAISVHVQDGVRATEVRLWTSLVHSGAVLQNTRIGLLRVTDISGRTHDFDIRVGVHASEKCYEIPNTRTHIRHMRAHSHASAAEFLAHGQAYIGKSSSATFEFEREIEPKTAEVFFSLDDPEHDLLRIYVEKVMFLNK